MRAATFLLTLATATLSWLPAASAECEQSSQFGASQLGVEVAEMTVELRLFFGAPANAGVLVARVTAGSPAERAGIRVGDVLLELDSRRLGSVDAVGEIVCRKRKSKRIAALVVRNKRQHRVQVRIDDRPASASMESECDGGWAPVNVVWSSSGSSNTGGRSSRRVWRPTQVIWPSSGRSSSSSNASGSGDKDSRVDELLERIEGLEKRIKQLERQRKK